MELIGNLSLDQCIQGTIFVFANNLLSYKTFRAKNCDIHEVGLVVCQSDPWLAVSPDGVIFENGEPIKLLEIKFPFIGMLLTNFTDYFYNCFSFQAKLFLLIILSIIANI